MIYTLYCVASGSVEQFDVCSYVYVCKVHGKAYIVNMLILVLMGTINLPLGHVYSNCLMFYKHFTNGTVFIILCNSMSLMSSSRIALRPDCFISSFTGDYFQI